jgi:8-oxo-dGTP pyrophosphatase MutT (NUDIX family)
MTDPNMKNGPWRANVAALIRVGNKFLRCERSQPRGVWQTVQGGIEDSDKSVQHALLRELVEELGVAPESVNIVARSSCWRRYSFPPEVLRAHPERNNVGQEQMWFLVELNHLSAIDLSRSEGEFFQVELVELEKLLANIVSWKLPVVKDFCYEMGLLSPFSG